MSRYIQGQRDRVWHIALPGAPQLVLPPRTLWTYCDRAYALHYLFQDRYTRPERVCKLCDRRAPADGDR